MDTDGHGFLNGRERRGVYLTAKNAERAKNFKFEISDFKNGFTRIDFPSPPPDGCPSIAVRWRELWFTNEREFFNHGWTRMDTDGHGFLSSFANPPSLKLWRDRGYGGQAGGNRGNGEEII